MTVSKLYPGSKNSPQKYFPIKFAREKKCCN